MKERLGQRDDDANLAVQTFENLSTPLVEYFSNTEAIFERKFAAIKSVTERMQARAGKLREMSSKLRHRLLDPKPFCDDDGELIKQVLDEALRDFTKATANYDVPDSPDFPQRPADLTTQLSAITTAGKAAFESFKRPVRN